MIWQRSYDQKHNTIAGTANTPMICMKRIGKAIFSCVDANLVSGANFYQTRNVNNLN